MRGGREACLGSAAGGPAVEQVVAVARHPVDAVSQPDADGDPREKARMFDKVGVTRERLAIGRSTAGLPRTYRTLRSKHRRLRDLLRETVSACGALLKSVVVRFGLHKTQRYGQVAENGTMLVHDETGPT